MNRYIITSLIISIIIITIDIVNFIGKHPGHKIAGVSIAEWVNLDSELSVEAYAEEMAKESSWGGALEIAVCGIVKGVNIHVYQAMDDGKYNPSKNASQTLKTNGKQN